MKHQSGLSKETEVCNRWTTIIQNNYQIKWNELKRALGLTINEYYKYKMLVEADYSEFVQYNKQNKTWTWIGKRQDELDQKEAESLV